MNKLITLIVALFLSLSLPALAAGNTPQEQIQAATDSLVVRIDKDRKAFDKNPQLLHNVVEENISPYVDFRTIARGVMGQFYRQASEQQRADFERVFKQSLIRTYANGMTAYNGQKYVVKAGKPSDKPTKAQVDMDVHGSSGKIYHVTYHLAQGKDGEWRIVNLILDGMNFGLAFRNKFAGLVEENKGSIDAAIANWVPDVKLPGSAGDATQAGKKG